MCVYAFGRTTYPTHGFQLLTPDRRLAAAPNRWLMDHFIGMVQDSQLPTNIARVDGPQTFAGIGNLQGAVVMTNTDNQIAGQFSGDGAGLRNLDAAQTPRGRSMTHDSRPMWGVCRLTSRGPEPTVSRVRFGLLTCRTNCPACIRAMARGWRNLNAASLQGELPASMREGFAPAGMMLASCPFPRISPFLPAGIAR